MGGGTYSYLDSHYRTTCRATETEGMSVMDCVKNVYTKKSLVPELNIKDKTRESRNSKEHPNSLPIIIALDVTGSMGSIPADLATNSFPEIMKNILDAGIKDPQVCFVAMGDEECDSTPIQCGQFESDDKLIEECLTNIYFEGGGGGNSYESQALAYYFAARHTQTDNKGILITISDEPCQPYIHKETVIKEFGDGCQADIPTETILEEAKLNWDIYHINLGEGVRYQSVIQGWNKLLGEDRVFTMPRDNYNMASIITSIILNSTSKEIVKSETKISL